MSREVEIVEVEPTDDLLRQIIDLGNGPAKQRLGFLPDEGFSDRARKGTLLAAVQDGCVMGYVLYDLPRRNVTIRQLCVSPQARGQGIARRLIESLSRRHEHRQRIDLWCRDDYGLAPMWQSLGFLPQGSRPGRSKEGHLLTGWVLDLDDSSYPTLFDEHRAERAIAALDHNVFLDLHINVSQRPQAQESHYLLEDWIADHAELCLTDEIFYEIYNHPNAHQRTVEQQWANRLRRISKPDDGWEAKLNEVARLASKAGEADHRHVARAIVGGADYFVSRDADLLAAAEAIEDAFDLTILPPAALIVRLDKERSDDPYQPVALAGTDLRQAPPAEDMHEEVLSALLNNGAGERRSELASHLRPILADRNHEIQIVQATDGRIVAGFARRTVDKRVEVSLLRVVPQHGSNAMARQLVFAQRKHAADHRLEGVQIVDPHPSKGVQEVLEREHFEENNNIWRSRVQAGLADVAEIDLQHPSPMTPAEYEDRYWPVKVVGADVPNYLVPIKMAFAEELGLAEETLLPRQLGLGLDREHVYYRSIKNDRGIAPGARILWYVSGNAPAQPRGSIRAISQVAEVVIGRPRTLHARFERFGVYSLGQVLERAEGTGEVMAIRFVNTEILERAIDLDELKAMWEARGKKFVPPFSPARVDEHMFCLLYKRSSAYA